MNKINLTGAWNTLWGKMSGAMGDLTTILSIIGVIIIALAIIKFVWDKKKGGGGNTSGVMWAAALGALLAGPQVVIPLVLFIIDLVINLFIAIFRF